jgi:transmembrane 9 superfamily member 2/4
MVFTLLNLLIHGTGTSGAVPLKVYFFLGALWFGISIPMAFIGGFFASFVQPITWPSPTNETARVIPPSPVSANAYLLFAAAGILPFCAGFIEMYFAMSSMWHGYFYYLFGFLSIVAFLVTLITAEVSILLTCAFS